MRGFDNAMIPYSVAWEAAQPSEMKAAPGLSDNQSRIPRMQTAFPFPLDVFTLSLTSAFNTIRG
jgi:hypothetical protein